jgi:hypothetical protein
MSCANAIQPQSAGLKKALRWFSDMTREHPDRKRLILLREAEVRFDLTPVECAFLNANFSDEGAATDC